MDPASADDWLSQAAPLSAAALADDVGDWGSLAICQSTALAVAAPVVARPPRLVDLGSAWDNLAVSSADEVGRAMISVDEAPLVSVVENDHVAPVGTSQKLSRAEGYALLSTILEVETVAREPISEEGSDACASGASSSDSAVLVPCDPGVAAPPAPSGESCDGSARFRKSLKDQSTLVSRTAEVLDRSIQVISAASCDVDEAAKSFLDEARRQKSGLHWDASIRVAEKLKVSRKLIDKTQALVSSATFLLTIHVFRQALRKLIAHVKALGGVPLLLSLFVRYDESPLTLTVVDFEALGPIAAIDGLDECVLEDLFGCLSNPRHDAGVTKLLQTEYIVSALFKVADQYFEYCFKIPVPPQAMGRTTSQAYYKALQYSQTALGLDEFRPAFRRSQRAAATDGDAAVDKSERAMSGEHGDVTLRTHCGIHHICSSRGRALALEPTAHTRLKHASLSLRMGNSLKLFRAAVRISVANRLVCVRDRVPSYNQRLRNEQSLSRCVPEEDSPLRASLLSLLPGDWSQSTIETFPPADVSDAEWREKLLITLVDDLIASGPRGFPTRNWIEAEQAPRWFLRMELPHKMFSIAYLSS